MPRARVLYLKGMHGMGDNFHQRAFIRKYLEEYTVVYLETSWPALYWDLCATGKLKLIRKDSSLRTQEKNSQREADQFYDGPIPHPTMREDKQIWYRAKDIIQTGSVLGAMGACLGRSVGDADFRFPLKDEWLNHPLANIDTGGKQILVYRPLVERTEWSGCSARNPDHDAYRAVYSHIRRSKRFYVVSVADVVPGKEWIVGDEGVPPADICFHKGELPVEILTALVSRSALTLNAPGFMTIMSQSQGTPNITVFGGYENSSSFTAGAKWGAYLGIDPINPCHCFQHYHDCDKRINMPEALQRVQRFVDEAVAIKASSRTAQAAGDLKIPA